MAQQAEQRVQPKKISQLVHDRTVDANDHNILDNSYVLITYVGREDGNRNYVVKYKDVVESFNKKYNELNEKNDWLYLE